jgi:hypothetical protein
MLFDYLITPTLWRKSQFEICFRDRGWVMVIGQVRNAEEHAVGGTDMPRQRRKANIADGRAKPIQRKQDL